MKRRRALEIFLLPLALLVAAPKCKPLVKANSAGIPRVVHQIWISTKPGAKAHSLRPADLPATNQLSSSSWAERMPDFEHRMWSNSEIRELITRHYHPDLLELYDSYPLDIMRADVARYAVMGALGGWYADSDLVLLRRLPREWFERQDTPLVLISINGGCGLRQDMFASAPGHPFWRLLLDSLAFTSRLWDVLWSTGPGLLRRVFAIARGMRMQYSLLNSTLFIADDPRSERGHVFARMSHTWVPQYEAWALAHCAQPPLSCSNGSLRLTDEPSAGAAFQFPADKSRDRTCLNRCLRAHRLLPLDSVAKSARLLNAAWTARWRACARPSATLPTITEEETPMSCWLPPQARASYALGAALLKSLPAFASRSEWAASPPAHYTAIWRGAGGNWSGWRVFGLTPG